MSLLLLSLFYNHIPSSFCRCREYDNTPLDGCVMRIFLCNSFTETSVSASTSRVSQTSEDRDSRRGKTSGGGGGREERGGGDADGRISSSSKTNSSSRHRHGNNHSSQKNLSDNHPSATPLFKVNDIPKVDSNKNFVSNFSDEMKHQSSKPRIPIKQGKWWHQQSRAGRSDY